VGEKIQNWTISGLCIYFLFPLDCQVEFISLCRAQPPKWFNTLDKYTKISKIIVEEIFFSAIINGLDKKKFHHQIYPRWITK
jgi:hypothetical protein